MSGRSPQIRRMTGLVLTFSATLALAGCNDGSGDPAAEIGPNPTLPAPQQYLLPPMHIARVVGWKGNETPTVAQGLKIQAMATGLQHPRSIYVLPNGDVLVVESKAPDADPITRPKTIVTRWVESWATSGGDTGPSNRITLLRDADGDGVPETKSVFLDHLNSPFGVALVGNDLYVANTDAIVRYPYKEGETKITEPGTVLTELPGGPIDHHWTKSLVASKDGSLLYVGVGSNSNITENGMEAEKNRAAILEVDRASGRSRIYADGLRNPNGLSFEPQSGALWTVVNERDELGPDLVPDYLTSVKDGGFYGWPYSYFGQHVDPRVQPQRPDLVAKAIVPDYALGNHTASLGLTFSEGTALPDRYRDGVFIGQHGSWNRNPRSGYKVIFVPFAQGRPSGQPIDVLTGFVNDKDEALGRPVGVVIDRAGALLVADDVGNVVWRVAPGQAKSAMGR
jgi:glucose/arabinose dehydrogenase